MDTSLNMEPKQGPAIVGAMLDPSGPMTYFWPGSLKKTRTKVGRAQRFFRRPGPAKFLFGDPSPWINGK